MVTIKLLQFACKIQLPTSIYWLTDCIGQDTLKMSSTDAHHQSDHSLPYYFHPLTSRLKILKSRPYRVD